MLRCILVLVFLFVVYVTSAQVNLKDKKDGKFTLLKVGKLQNSLEDENIKYLSNGVIFKIDNMEIHADSAVIMVNDNRFEAFGKVNFYKNGKINFSSDRAYYRSEARHIMLMDNISSYDKDGTISKIMVPIIEFDIN